ncbi:hypothetical protein ACP70R_017870 [Stipagrostis hirtigluma subsp. patula]
MQLLASSWILRFHLLDPFVVAVHTRHFHSVVTSSGGKVRAMKSVGKAAELLRKAAAALQGRAAVLRARLLFLASLRRRAAVVARISRHVRALATGHGRGQGKAAARGRGGVLPPAERADVTGEERETAPAAAGPRDQDVVVVGLPELARLFEEVDDDGDGDGGYADLTLALQALFNDDDGGHVGDSGAEHRDGDSDVVDAPDEEEPSVIDVIRSRREGDGLEFRIEDEIDQAADMFITRVRRRMAAQPELAVSGFHF